MCQHIQEVDEQLKQHGQQLVQRIVMVDGQMQFYPALEVEWIGKKPHGQKLKAMLVKYCPFCGEKLA